MAQQATEQHEENEGLGRLASFTKTLVHEGGSDRTPDVKRSTHQFLPSSLGPKQLALSKAFVRVHAKNMVAAFFVFSC